MKAFYCLWPNFEYIDKLVDSGIDTIILAAHNLPFDEKNINQYYDIKKTILLTIKRYENDVHFLLSPLWIRDWVKLPLKQRWVLENGKTLEYQPCPLNMPYIYDRIKQANYWIDRFKIDGIIWDLEHYGQEQNTESYTKIIPYYREFIKPVVKCYCKRCQNVSIDIIWKSNAQYIKSNLERLSVDVHGSFPYSSGWGMRQFPDKLCHFTEETYYKDISRWERLKWDLSYKWYNVNPTIVPGAWAEYFTEDNFIDYLKYLKNKYGHFWIYSHEKFGNKIPNPHINYPHPNKMSDVFFKKLKNILRGTYV